MSQNKIPSLPALARIAEANKQGVVDWIEKHATTKQEREAKALLKSIYRSGATGTPRNLTQDLETITKLIQGDTDV